MVNSWNEARKVCLEDLVVIKFKKELKNKTLGKGRGNEGWKEGKVRGKREGGKRKRKYGA